MGVALVHHKVLPDACVGEVAGVASSEVGTPVERYRYQEVMVVVAAVIHTLAAER